MAESSHFLTTLSTSPQTFLQPSIPLYTDTLAYLKHALDPIAAEVSNLQHSRRQEARKKRKRGSRVPEEDVLRLKQIHTDGFTVEQVWEQSRRVVDAVVGEVERSLLEAERKSAATSQRSNGRIGQEDSLDEEESSLGEEGVDFEVEGPDSDNEAWDDEGDGLSDSELLDTTNARDDEMDLEMDNDDSAMEDELLANDEPPEEFVADKFGLNDGFFSIDAFNRNSEFLEQQDVRGEDDGAASDEEDLDWDADPLAQALIGTQNGQSGGELEEDDEDDEDGPTFGDPDAASEDEEDELMGGEMNDMEGMGNTNNIMYADFFAPPAQQKKKRKNKKGRPNPHNFPGKSANGTQEDGQEETEEDMERTMAAVHRDLFDDEESEPESDNLNNLPNQDSTRSTHEKRRAALANEIRQLEAAAVAKRSWTLAGEAAAADRPINSLLEEDLDFERAGKPVPVITAEVSESIEELIKRRILAHEFQDIARRRPDDLVTGKDARRGRQDFILDDERSKKGLAEEYEEEHLRRSDPNFVDAKDAKTKKEEGEILALWRKISTDLDGLSSWRFRPRAPAPTLSILVDAPAIAVEDARPSAGGEVAGASQLAPQEVYRAGEAAAGVKSEVVGKSGLPSAREEVEREDKKRKRRREKERARKAGGNAVPANAKGPNGKASRAEERKKVLGDLKRGGVGVIGKKGDITDVAGREMKGGEKVAVGGGGRFKL